MKPKMSKPAVELCIHCGEDWGNHLEGSNHCRSSDSVFTPKRSELMDKPAVEGTQPRPCSGYSGKLRCGVEVYDSLNGLIYNMNGTEHSCAFAPGTSAKDYALIAANVFARLNPMARETINELASIIQPQLEAYAAQEVKKG